MRGLINFVIGFAMTALTVLAVIFVFNWLAPAGKTTANLGIGGPASLLPAGKEG